MFGQVVSLTIAILIGSIPSLPLWIRQSLATSLAVTVMVKMGWTHPPAGAAALIFSSGTLGWLNALFMIIGNMVR